MEFSDFYAGKNDCGRRLDRVLKNILKDTPSANVFQAIRKKLILVNDAKTHAPYRIALNDKISIAKFLLGKSNNLEYKDVMEPSINQKNIDIILKTPDILILNKAYGINVQPSGNNETSLSDIVKKFYLPEDSVSSLSFTPGPLHRLDKYTSGLLAFSQSLRGAQWFTDAIRKGYVKKTYIGIAVGHLKSPVRWVDGIDDFSQDKLLASGKGFHPVKVVEATEKNIAVTNAEPLGYGCCNGVDISLVKYNIETGRKHQIRAQSAFHGFPLFADVAYGEKSYSDRMFYLHACRLDITGDNILGLPETIVAPVPEYFRNFMKSSLINCWEDFII